MVLEYTCTRVRARPPQIRHVEGHRKTGSLTDSHRIAKKLRSQALELGHLTDTSKGLDPARVCWPKFQRVAYGALRSASTHAKCCGLALAPHRRGYREVFPIDNPQDFFVVGAWGLIFDAAACSSRILTCSPSSSSIPCAAGRYTLGCWRCLWV